MRQRLCRFNSIGTKGKKVCDRTMKEGDFRGILYQGIGERGLWSFEGFFV